MGRMKVLMLLHDLSRTGAPKVALDAMQSLADRVDVRFVASEQGPLAQRCRSLGPLLLPLLPTPRGRFKSRIESWRRRIAWRSVTAWGPDLIYANSVMALPLADWLERVMGLPRAPMLLHVHELDSVLAAVKQTHSDWLVRRPQCYVGVSEIVCRRLVEFAGVDASKIVHVPEFVRELDFQNLTSPARAGGHNPPRASGDEVVVVGGSGLPSWRKNTTLWLQVAAATRDRRDVRFRWVGVPDGPGGEIMRVKRRLLGLEDRVELVGITDRPLEAFAQFDIFLLTSWEDPFPLVVLENMMLEKPVVCLPGGGAPDEVGPAGVVVDQFHPRAVADAIAALLADPERRRQLGAAARQRILDNFTDRVCVPRLWEAMQQTAAARVE